MIEAEQMRQGFTVSVKLPKDLDILEDPPGRQHANIEELDFFSGRKYLSELLERENWKCFYCLKTIAEETCELDHVVPLADHGDNGYKNIVATCHGCNSRKQGILAEDFLRQIYRANLLGEEEFSERFSTLELLKEGKVVPNIAVSWSIDS